jgi:predicted MFS family arabinose efflux permease
MSTNPALRKESMPFTSYQKFVIAILAFMQFTLILDFMIISPLGALLMPALHITPQQFGLVVSVYAFSAGASGILAAGFADRFDRKKLLLFFYGGFLLGTLLCGVAPSYQFLLGARMVTGLFGGVIGSIVLAITTDLFPFEMRGRVMGVISTAFSASQVLGIPVGVLLSSHWGWHMPFLMIVVVGLAVGAVILKYMQPIDAHLKLQTDRKPFEHLRHTLSNPRYLQAFATVALLSTGGFMLMPFGSAFSVHNLGIEFDKLSIVYLASGMCSIVTGPLVGRLSDRLGKFKTFVFGTLLSMVMVIIYTRLGVTPIYTVILISAVMFVGISSRMIPAQALMSAIPEPANRGSFMSVSSSVQQVSGGLAAVLAGLIVVERADGYLEHFDTLGYVVVGASLVTLILMYFIHRLVPEK